MGTIRECCCFFFSVLGVITVYLYGDHKGHTIGTYSDPYVPLGFGLSGQVLNSCRVYKGWGGQAEGSTGAPSTKP